MTNENSARAIVVLHWRPALAGPERTGSLSRNRAPTKLSNFAFTTALPEADS